jgi:hypothetical protein
MMSLAWLHPGDHSHLDGVQRAAHEAAYASPVVLVIGLAIFVALGVTVMAARSRR